MDLVSIEYRDKVAVAKLKRGVTNPLNLELVRELADNVRTVRDNLDVNSLVLTSANQKFFSIGFDIPELIQLAEEDFRIFYGSFNRLSLDLYTLAKPTVAAITGHATAGGCILTLCCDYRFIAEGRKLMGVNEVKLGVPVPYPGDCILRHLVDVRHAREILGAGEFYGPEESLQMGVVDQVLPPEEVVSKAIEKARSLGALPQQAFATIKRNRVEPVEKAILAQLADKEQLFMRHWFAVETQERLREAMKKF